jgi:hypothetical protein
MASKARRSGGLPLKALAMALGAWISSGFSSVAHGNDPVPGPGYGTLGYGGPGAYPGYQGFGLGYWLGYGYGGSALGPGATGGYPFYGGPGYPHPWPRLRRFGSATPFPFYGGPGGPTPTCPNFFGIVGPLTVDHPVVLETERQDLGFGPFTGVLPYPEAVFAPYASAAAAIGTTSETSPALPNVTPVVVPLGHPLGIEEEPVIDPDGVRGIKVVRVQAETVADKANLRAGDVIRSANGYLTTQRGNLTWIIDNEAQGHVLDMTVRSAADGRVSVIRAQLPVMPVNTTRPPYLPPVGNGPPPASR